MNEIKQLGETATMQMNNLKTQMTLPKLANPQTPPVVDGQRVPTPGQTMQSLPVMPQMKMPPMPTQMPNFKRGYAKRTNWNTLYKPISDRINKYRSTKNKYYKSINV